MVAAIDPARTFTVDLTADSASFSANTETKSPDVELPAEALVRLLYGRLDPGHTPFATADTAALDTLRLVFPGP